MPIQYRPIVCQLVLLLALWLPFAVVHAEEEALEAAAIEEISESAAVLDLQTKAETLNVDIQKLVSELERLEDQVDHVTGETLEVTMLERQRATMSILDLLFSLSNNLQKQNELGSENAELRDLVVSYLIRSSNALDQFIDREFDGVQALRSQSEDLTGFDLVEAEQMIATRLTWIENLYEAKVQAIVEMQQLGLEVENHTENLKSRLKPLATNLTGQLQLV